jgi:uncharacterized DUF497 family protein
MPEFDWDENKNRLNIQKHKIAFYDAIDVFNDMDRIEYTSEKDGETRKLTIGKAFLVIVAVIYTTRDLVVRIISARRANSDERRAYLATKFNGKRDET